MNQGQLNSNLIPHVLSRCSRLYRLLFASSENRPLPVIFIVLYFAGFQVTPARNPIIILRFCIVPSQVLRCRMDNKDEQGEHAPRGNEWEVVSLTASAYAAAPGPYNIELRDARKYDTYYEAETSNTLFMSDHFVFPPSEHENVPVETFFSEPDNDKGSKYVDPLFETDQAKHTDEKDEKDSTMRGADLPNAFSRTWFRDEMGNKKQSIYGESTLGSVQSETASSRATKHEHESHYVESNETLEGGLDLHSDASNLFRSPSKDAKDATYNLPCEAWWRRRVVSVYAHAKEAKAFWSLFFAAAVTGLVILGQRWQQERWQGLHLKWQSSIGSEKLSRVLGPLAHFKDSAAGVN